MAKETFNTLEELLSKYPKTELGRAQDLSGRKINHITFIYRVNNGKKDCAYWASKCDCGKYFIARSASVSSNHTMSCGCIHVPHFKAAPPMKDITNQRFGKLIVIKPVDRAKNKAIKWLCQCDCGNTAVVCSHELFKGQTNSCGCIRKPSSYELKAMDWLNAHGFAYFREVRVAELGQLRFDFKVFLPHDQYCFIEVQGQHHYYDMPGYMSEKKFQQQLERDERKTKYCAVNNIPFLRIAYNEDIEEKLQQFFSTLTFNDQSKDVGPSGSKREGK